VPIRIRAGASETSGGILLSLRQTGWARRIPRAVRFDRAQFVATFHGVFERCRNQGVSLHRTFLPLGIYLVSLHDHLGALGGEPFDVRSAFERAARWSRQQSPRGVRRR